MAATDKDVIWFEELTIGDVGIVGGKNASLGEMVRELAPKGIEVPPGFATSADAFRRYITANALDDRIAQAMDRLGAGKATLQDTGSRIRQSILEGEWPEGPRRRSARPMPNWPAAPARRSRPSPSAPRPRPRTCRTPASRASRRPS
jgi:pyruvate, water dikinase